MRGLRSFLLGLLIVVGVLAVLLAAVVFGGDGIIRDKVEEQAARTLRSAIGSSATPQVTVEGYPVAWHLLTTSFPAVRVQAPQMDVQMERGGVPITLTAVDLTFRDVKATGNAMKAGSAAGGARLGYPELGALAGVKAKSGGGDQVTFTSDVEVLGATFPIDVTGKLAVDAGARSVTLTESTIDVAGVAVPKQVSKPVVDAMLKPVSVPLPYGLRLQGMTPDADGVAVTVDGTDLTFPLNR